ncbi:general transcription factor II-I repeat domain-containing protein 2A [Trichonephila clavipes]|nr:general transcription factor II-I repeat domain-containing protein 2A [Trichonephila clavipes]
MLQINKKTVINSAPFTSLCFESIDITKSARLAVFARYCVRNVIEEELIAITSLLTTTKGTDICTAKKWHVDPKRFATPKLEPGSSMGSSDIICKILTVSTPRNC